MQSPAGRISIAALYKTLITLNHRLKKPPQFQLYCTAATIPNSITSINGDSVVTHHDNVSSSNNKPKKKKRKQKKTLYSKISPLGNPTVDAASLIDQWVKDGKKVFFAELQRITRDLRGRSRFSQALQVSEWMKNSEAFTFLPAQHAVHMDLIGKVHGYLSAETYFNNLSEEDKTEKTNGALLHCYVRQRDTVKALSHLQSMKEKGLKLSCVAYNDIMSLYTNTGKHELVPDVLSQMKENEVSPDNMSYKICLNSYGQRSDIMGMETLLNEMEHQPELIDWSTYSVVANFYTKEGLTEKANDFLKKAEEKLPVKDANGYNHLISLHATLGNKSEIFRLWSLEKTNCKMHVNRDYINMLCNLVRINEVEEAEKVLEEWESSGNQFVLRIPYIIIDKYIEKGEFMKAENLLNDLIEKGKPPNADRWGKVVAGHLEVGNKERAVECMKIAISVGKEKKWKPEHSLMTRLLHVLGVEEDTNDIDTDTLVDTFLTRTSEEKMNTSSSVNSSEEKMNTLSTI